MSKFIKFFDELGIKDVPMVGGKNASLGEMYQKLTKQGITVPNGFATTAEAYNFFMEKGGLKKEIEKILKGLDTKNVGDLVRRGAKVRKTILAARLPKELEAEIRTAYAKLSKSHKMKNVDVAVRSSATAEDLPDASFAGQQDTYLNIQGAEYVIDAVKRCIASLFTNRAISYRTDKGFDHFQIALSAGVQKMARSDKGSSGVMFSIDTESGFQNVVMINSIYGLGENIVQGKVNPDEFYVFKPTGAIITKKMGKKNLRMIYSSDPKNPVKDINVPPAEQAKYSINDAQIKQLAKWAMIIEKHYGRPMDMEWALDGNDNKLYIIQARPETVHSTRDVNVLEDYRLQAKGKLLISGQSVGSRIGAGTVNKIMDIKQIESFKKGDVLLTDMTDPDWEPIMKIASAIVTDKGGRTCHAAIISRELGIPCVVGTNTASSTIKTGTKVTVSCAEGEEGFVYEGELPYKINRTDVKNLKKPKTKIMMNVGEPDQAFLTSFVPNDGVGLARLEFIINNYIKIHPLALINYTKIKDKEVKRKIDEITFGYKNKTDFFVEKLASGVAMIAAAFYPKDVIVRLSDFKSNEYANLIGGAEYEPVESNPMIGYRGASRYYSEKFLPAFKLECAALKKVRDDMGLTNLKIMIPFCRTVEEGKAVKKIMAENGLVQGKNGLEVYVMAEIPANIILATDFAKEFDGFSIGSNDLTQLTLGIDRDAAGMIDVAGPSNEKNPAVKTLIKYLIQVGKDTKTKVGICGQAPSDFPEFATFLVEEGIDSISLIPDTVVKTTLAVLKKEEEMAKKKKK
ncbi:phosphoenolpyruvate synthase [Candidatus Parcubacteria bacterium]|nr:phosphoenolpyruvate synthase [Patescibacteria group bacterium]MBU4309619.1 phosphoenolpyruvate synthase [Patescibacteria group bacterium]MBU4432139.1 phosphoenolpyruvate synthase [Patescibacteria group bacterium]MBU4577993.1 phosphoenolpyruvate synthase [Patescibacteria group bacterium]MCG2696499.1 phosphoenolpyruvate synthase [Candidatus Parcubacteria bacterium]